MKGGWAIALGLLSLYGRGVAAYTFSMMDGFRVKVQAGPGEERQIIMREYLLMDFEDPATGTSFLLNSAFVFDSIDSSSLLQFYEGYISQRDILGLVDLRFGRQALSLGPAFTTGDYLRIDLTKSRNFTFTTLYGVERHPEADPYTPPYPAGGVSAGWSASPGGGVKGSIFWRRSREEFQALAGIYSFFRPLLPLNPSISARMEGDMEERRLTVGEGTISVRGDSLSFRISPAYTDYRDTTSLYTDSIYACFIDGPSLSLTSGTGLSLKMLHLSLYGNFSILSFTPSSTGEERRVAGKGETGIMWSYGDSIGAEGGVFGIYDGERSAGGGYATLNYIPVRRVRLSTRFDAVQYIDSSGILTPAIHLEGRLRYILSRHFDLQSLLEFNSNPEFPEEVRFMAVLTFLYARQGGAM